MYEAQRSFAGGWKVNGDIADMVLAQEKLRHSALLAGDMGALSKLLSDRLTFVHANGVTDDKASLLTKMSSGSIKYVALALEQANVILLGTGSALITGRLTADLLVGGTPKRVCNLTLSAWALEDDDWRLFAYQPTPVTC